MTSGTTGKPKHIPVTRRFLADIRRGWNVFGLNLLNRHPRAWVRPIVQISSSMRETLSPTGLPCGAISGLLAATQKRIVQWMYVVPRWVAGISDPLDRFYSILRHSIAHDVAFITTANPSSTLKLFETAQAEAPRLIRDLADGRFRPPGGSLPEGFQPKRFRPDRKTARRLQEALDRRGRLMPRDYWNLEFLTNWTGGTLRLYVRRLREMVGEHVAIQDIGLLASEGRFSIPLRADGVGGVAEITSNFLEFIPAACHEQDDPPTLQAHELEDGEEYFLVVSNYAGLFRYNLDDRVRVVARHTGTPVLEFLSRGLHTANITGEKITEHQVVEAMRTARRREGLPIERFVVQGRFSRRPYYELRVEDVTPEQADRLAQDMETALTELNIEYASKRKSGRLGPIRAVVLSAGELERVEREAIRRRRGRCEQYKHQYLETEVLDDYADARRA
jgi:hypothetical protein